MCVDLYLYIHIYGNRIHPRRLCTLRGTDALHAAIYGTPSMRRTMQLRTGRFVYKHRYMYI